MSENTPKSPRKVPPGHLSQVFVKARADVNNSSYNKVDYFVNVADVSYLYERGKETHLRVTSDGAVSSFKIPGMTLADTAEALATRGIELVDLKQVSDELKAKKVKKAYKPVEI